MIGETIGSFKVTSRLGRGVTAEIFLGESSSGQKAGIKLLHPELAGDAELVKRFFNEAKTTARIRHPGVIEIFETGFYGQGQPYVAMEHLEGESLGKRIAASGRLSSTQIAELCQQIAAVLAATHAVGITHRNLEPENVYIVTAGGRETVKLLGFDIAKVPGEPPGAPMWGSPPYVAPEEFTEGATIDARADVYSLGCLAFTMACGTPPFALATLDDARQHAAALAPRVRSLAPDAPIQLDHLLSRLLAKKPGERPQVMDEISRAFSVLGRGALSNAPLAVTEMTAALPASMLAAAPVIDPLHTVSGSIVARPAPRDAPITAGHIVVSPSMGAIETGVSGIPMPSAPAMSGLRRPDEAPQQTLQIKGRARGPRPIMIFALLLGVGVIVTVVVLVLQR